MKYIAVGFKVNKDRSVFYISDDEHELAEFLNRLANKIDQTNPDFVSLRICPSTYKATESTPQ